MSAGNILPLLILTPLLGSFSIACTSENSADTGALSIWTAAFGFLLSLILFLSPEEKFSLLNLSFSVNHISVYMIAATFFVCLTAALTDPSEIRADRRKLHVLAPILASLATALFSCSDILVFCILLQLIAVIAFIMLGICAGDAISASKFFIIFSSGNILVFCGAIYLIGATGIGDINVLARHTLTPKQENIVFFLFAVGFACQTALFPFHVWLSDSHVAPPTAVSMIFAGILMKIGPFGMMTLLLPIAENAASAFGPYVFAAAIATAVWAIIFGLLQRDLKRIVSALSLACAAVSVIGIFSLTEEGISGAFFYMTAGGFIFSALFTIIAAIEKRFGSRDVGISGVSRVIPSISIAAAAAISALASVPPLPCFVGNFLILFGCLKEHPCISLIIGLLTASVAFLTLKTFYKMFAGECNMKKSPLTADELTCLLPSAVLILLMGIFPNKILQSVKHNVAVILGEES
ncbi:MAG: hypothetical protein LBO73_00870 [Holosporaceae bacterium]|jgi:NADH-quinone oxidoreductase subunit M|nr:hypothetical protein [Holosporaceae bacterium]